MMVLSWCNILFILESVKNNDDLNKHIKRLKINAPKTGNIRLLQITENQYNNMIMFSGTKSVEEEISIENLLIFE